MVTKKRSDDAIRHAVLSARRRGMPHYVLALRGGRRYAVIEDGHAIINGIRGGHIDMGDASVVCEATPDGRLVDNPESVFAKAELSGAGATLEGAVEAARRARPRRGRARKRRPPKGRADKLRRANVYALLLMR